MTQFSTLWLGALLAILPALEQALRTGTWPQWLAVPQLIRGIIIVLVGAGTGVLGSVLNDGLTWQQGLAAGAVVAIPAILKLVFHAEAAEKVEDKPVPVADPPSSGPSNPIPPAAALLVIGMMAFGSQACRATFDEVRPKSALKGLSVAGVQLLTPGSTECLSLSRQENTWTGLAIAGGILGTSGTVGALIDLGIRDEAKAEVYVMLAAGGLIDAAAAFAAQQAAGYGRDFVALGCGGQPAP